MKIEIEIPDYIPPSRIIYIMAGMHKVGYIEPNTRKVFVQTVGCSQCGACCKRIDCKELVKEPGDNDMWRCDNAVMRPFLCCISEPNTKKAPDAVPGCTIRYREVI